VSESRGGARRVGVFGGTFDPPHVGHVSVAAEVADTLDLDEVLWVPAADPPHKPYEPLAPVPLRLRMVRAATRGDPRFRVSEVEISRAGPSYTIDTLEELVRGSLAGCEIFLIMGLDQFLSFDTWHRPDSIRALAKIAVMDRGGEGASEELLRGDDSVVRVPVGRVDVSSTRIRDRVARGEAILDLVPEAVARIIDAEHLYRGHR